MFVEEPKANTNILIFSILLMSTEASRVFLGLLHKANRLKWLMQLNECDAPTDHVSCLLLS